MSATKAVFLEERPEKSAKPMKGRKSTADEKDID